MGLTMSEKVQAARDRALLISQQDADAPRLTDRLDAQSLAVLVDAFDATRAKLAEVERDRDEARDKRAHETQHLLNCCAERDKALAAREAECARLREALRRAAVEYDITDAYAQQALASAPGSRDALREVVAAALAVQREISTQQYGVALSESSIAAIVSRILGERSDDAPQWRGERGKEGGDE